MSEDTAIEGEIVPHGAPVGRPSSYTDALGEEICERLAGGESLVSICRDEHMPSLRTAMRWAKDKPGFVTEYAHAREAQAETMDDLILMSAATTNAVNAPARRVQIDAYKWRAAKLAPKRFGDKLDVSHKGAVVSAKVDLPDDQIEAARKYRDLMAGIEDDA